MKLIITSVALASLFSFAACNRSELKEKEAALEAQQRTIDSMNTEIAKQKIIDSMTDATSMQYVLPPAAIPAPVVYSTRKANSSRYSGRNRTTSTSNSTNSTNTVAQAPVAEQPAAKKGWSAKAKGAVIGAGTGAAAGAIINKRNRAAGAVIGGILGAGAGTGVGAVIDKKNDR